MRAAPPGGVGRRCSGGQLPWMSQWDWPARARSQPVRPSYVGALSALALRPVANSSPAAMVERIVRAATILHEVMLMGSPSVRCPSAIGDSDGDPHVVTGPWDQLRAVRDLVDLEKDRPRRDLRASADLRVLLPMSGSEGVAHTEDPARACSSTKVTS